MRQHQSPVTRHAFAARGGALLAAACLALLVSGCANVSYYLQSVSGQLDVWRRERPIEDVIADPATAQALKDRLAQVLEIRTFASRELGLPDNDSYRRYADLGRPFVVWNVFAAPEFSVQPLQSCFLFAGCVSYRGYFARDDAERFAAGLAEQGHDVYVGGVPAYSTLGYFADPGAQYLHPLPGSRDRAPDLPRAGAPGRLRARRHRVQRVLRGGGRAGGRAALAGARRGREAARAVRARAGASARSFPAWYSKYRERLEALYRTRLAPDAMREPQARDPRRARSRVPVAQVAVGRILPATTAGSPANPTTRSSHRSRSTRSWCRRSRRCLRARRAIFRASTPR